MSHRSIQTNHNVYMKNIEITIYLLLFLIQSLLVIEYFERKMEDTASAKQKV